MRNLKPMLITQRYFEALSHSPTLFPQHKVVGLLNSARDRVRPSFPDCLFRTQGLAAVVVVI